MSSFKEFLILSEVESTVNELNLLCEHEYVNNAKELLTSLYNEYRRKDSGESYHDEVESIIREINGLMKHLPPFVEVALKGIFTKLTSEILGFEQADVPERIMSEIVFSHYAKLVVFEYLISTIVHKSIDPKFKEQLEDFAHSIYQILCADDNKKSDSIFKGFSYYRNSIISAKSSIVALHKFMKLMKSAD